MDTNNKNSKKINGTLIKESLMDYNNLAQELKENVTDSVKSLLDEQVKQAYAAILNESDEDENKDEDYEVEEVDDTTDDTEKEDDVENSDETVEDSDDDNGTELDDNVDDSEVANNETDDTDGEDVIDSDIEDDVVLDKFKVSDNKYDFRNAKDDEFVKIYKRLKNDDQVTVVKDGDKLSISDKETDSDYIIELSDDDEVSVDNEEIELNDMKESRIYEIALNEYDSNLGYTDNYQDKDVMTNDGVEETGNGTDADAGVPKTAKKPWSNKKNGAPFNKKTNVAECGDVTADNSTPEMDETVAEKGGTNRGMAKSHVPNTSCKNNPPKHKTSFAGEYQGNPNSVSESIVKKANKIFNENKILKEQLEKITNMLKEAAVTNVNLGGIIKLISENATTKEEKRDIINRFTNEVHTVEESKNLYRTISNELSKSVRPNVSINEEKEFGSSNAEVINESKFYQDESLMGSLGLMHKICK